MFFLFPDPYDMRPLPNKNAPYCDILYYSDPETLKVTEASETVS